MHSLPSAPAAAQEKSIKCCTWQDPPDKRCERLAVIDHVSKDGETWARLCKEHDKELVDSQADPINVPYMLRCYVRAGGGAKVMAARAMGGAK